MRERREGEVSLLRESERDGRARLRESKTERKRERERSEREMQEETAIR